MTECHNQQGDSIYPSIRQLPLLGVGYADLYRRTRVQETVFESLTKEYEMAKVEEAKEIPTVKVLDASRMSRIRESFPPRSLIALLGDLAWLCVQGLCSCSAGLTGTQLTLTIPASGSPWKSGSR